MFEESVATIPSILASINSWLTPTVLFVLLNVMIATIAFTSTLTNQQNNHQQQENHHHQHQHQQQQQQKKINNNKLHKSPSLLQRVRSINFYSSYRSQEPSTNLVNNVKSPSDSNTLYKTLENPSHYIFEQPHHHHLDEQGGDSNVLLQMQYNLYPPHETNSTLYDYEHTHQLETSLNPSYYSFEHLHERDSEAEINVFQGNAQQMNTQYFYEHIHEGKAEETSNQFVLEEKNQENFEEDEVGELQSLDEVYSKLTGHHHHVSRTKSDTETASGEVPEKLPTKMRKSASLKSPFSHFEEEDIVESRRPATVKERGAKVTEVDHEVDAKADDFINKFKNQLKLQRMDSIIRYKDMVNRGSEK